MEASEGRQPSKLMPFALRPLEEGDIRQSEEIERDAFPTMFPRTSFRYELTRDIARYLVACSQAAPLNGSSHFGGPDPSGLNGGPPVIARLLRGARDILAGGQVALPAPQPFLTGFVGIWYIVDEAHIVSVGVRSAYRGLGIGEMLLIGAIEQAMGSGAGIVTLEVRASNHTARNLYLKYGFTDRGVRKGYYADNREDAIIMSTEPIGLAPYRDSFRRLVEAHEERWGWFPRTLF